jgi:hypothetical protein
MDAISSILSACRDLKLAEANEAATRLKVVDRVLREVLGWTDSDINPEERVAEAPGRRLLYEASGPPAPVGGVVSPWPPGARP